jgi:hypothetical protein
MNEEFNKNDWIGISQSEYRRIKNENPKFCNSYTARIKFKYFKLKVIPSVIILDNNELSILKYAEEFPENFKKISEIAKKSL